MFALLSSLLIAQSTGEISIALAQQKSAKNERLPAEISWKPIATGVEYAAQKVMDNPAAGDGVLHIVRIDPAKAKLRSLMASAIDRQPRTAQNWCTSFGLTAVINAGMYDLDHLTHVGYMKSENHVNNRRWSKQYNSVFVSNPLKPDLPQAQIIDLTEDRPPVLESYGTVIQNLRLIKGTGINAWKEQPKKWSESALAIDNRGRVLFLFMRSPLSMHEFNEKILQLPLNISRAMHLEGGPVSSFSICAHAKQIHLSGALDMGPIDDGGKYGQWPLPNVIGVVADQ